MTYLCPVTAYLLQAYLFSVQVKVFSWVNGKHIVCSSATVDMLLTNEQLKKDNVNRQENLASHFTVIAVDDNVPNKIKEFYLIINH